MSTHLTPDQFVEALEHPLPPDRETHVAECAVCANQLMELRALTDDVVLAGRVPEPSPLFWSHLSERVREAVDAQPVPVSWWRDAWRPLVAVAGVVAVLVMAVVLRPGSRVMPAVERIDTTAADASAADAAMSAESEAVWDMISALAPSIPVDEAVAAGMEPGRGATQAAIDALTDAERQALVKLLRAEIGSAG